MAELYYDGMRHQFLLQNGEPVTNLLVTEMNINYNSFPVYDMSGKTTAINGIPECDMRISYEAPNTQLAGPAVEAVSKAEMDRVKEEIRQTFIGK